MTIFILDQDPKMTAQYLDDKSLDKMIRDIAQVLCNVHHDLLFDEFNKSSLTEILKINYKLDSIPLKSNEKACLWTQWVLECRANYLFMVELLDKCLQEFWFRFELENRKLDTFYYKYYIIFEWARDNVPDLPLFKNNTYLCNTPIPLFIPKKYQLGLVYKDNSVTIRSYRNYYQDKLKTRIEAYNEWLDDVSCIGLEGCGSVSVETFESANWTNRRKPEWLNI